MSSGEKLIVSLCKVLAQTVNHVYGVYGPAESALMVALADFVKSKEGK